MIARVFAGFAACPLLEDGLEKASRGLTSIAEVLRMLPRTDKPRPLLEIRRLSRSTDV